MDLDFYLLDLMLDELLAQTPTQQPSSSALIRVEQDHAPDLHRLMVSYLHKIDWNLVEAGLSPPLVCISCLSADCDHIQSFYCSDDPVHSSIHEVWTDTQLAKYAEATFQYATTFGLFN